MSGLHCTIPNGTSAPGKVLPPSRRPGPGVDQARQAPGGRRASGRGRRAFDRGRVFDRAFVTHSSRHLRCGGIPRTVSDAVRYGSSRSSGAAAGRPCSWSWPRRRLGGGSSWRRGRDTRRCCGRSRGRRSRQCRYGYERESTRCTQEQKRQTTDEPGQKLASHRFPSSSTCGFRASPSPQTLRFQLPFRVAQHVLTALGAVLRERMTTLSTTLSAGIVSLGGGVVNRSS